MRSIFICSLVLFMTGLVWAGDPKEADSAVQYEVMTTSTVGSWMIGNSCTMSLRDEANTGMAFVVQRRGHGACHVWDSGTVLHGRREKDKIALLVRDDKGGAENRSLAHCWNCGA